MREDNKVQCPQCLAYNPEDSQFCNKCGSNLEISQDTLTSPLAAKETESGYIYFAPGDLFADRYTIIEEIGRGGMGVVYKAEDRILGIKVALKIIHPLYSSSANMVRQFKKETLLARSISHENVIRIHDIGVKDNINYISMDYIKGQNLKEFIRVSGALAVNTAINITKQICEALATAHRKGVIHLDLKPQNIMVDNNGNVYTMDFGLARSVVTPASSLSKKIMGTPAYMSPEQAKAEETDHRSDIYSIGIIMFEMFTGTLPFDAETREGYIQKHIEEKPKPPAQVNPLIPDAISKIILKCMEKDKNERFQAVKEILEEIQQPLEYRITYPQKQTKRKARLLYTIPLVFFIAVGAYFILKGKGGDELHSPILEELVRPSVAVLRFENNTGDDNLANWSKILQNSLIIDLAQSKYFRILPEDRLSQILIDNDLQESEEYSSEGLEKIAKGGNVQYLILGSYAKAGDKFLISAMIRESKTQRLLGTEKVEGTGEASFIDMVDSLTKKIKKRLKLTPEEMANDIDQDIIKITTRSPEAWEHYNDGIKYIQERKFKEGIASIEEAVKIDPEFAMAYKVLSETSLSLYDYEKGNKYLLKALEYIHRVSDRERYLIQGYAAWGIQNAYTQAIDSYKNLLKIYPDDEEGNKYLGMLYRMYEEWDLALGCYEKILKSDNPVERANAIDNIAFIFISKGLNDEAIQIMETNQHIFSNQSWFHRFMGNLYMCKGDYIAAQNEAEKALEIDPDFYDNHRLLGNVFLLKEDFDSATISYQNMIDKDDPDAQAWGLYWKANLFLTQGRYKKAQEVILSGIDLSRDSSLGYQETSFLMLLVHAYLQQKNALKALEISGRLVEMTLKTGFTDDRIIALHSRGISYVMLENLAEAKNTSEQLKTLIEDVGFPKQMRFYHHLVGCVLLKEEDVSPAINQFEKAFSLLSDQAYVYDNHAQFLDGLAYAYFANSDFVNAAEHYETISRLSAGRMTWGGIYAKSFYMMGKIYQAQKQKDLAIQAFQKFLRLWENADPDLVEIDDAKERLIELQTIS
jgi:serine/threonine protein kinase/Tfp pilus assembly protein PilF